MLKHYESHLSTTFPKINKYVNYSISAVSAKLVAMIFEAPLTLLKTRVERISSKSVMEEAKIILRNPMKDSLRGLGSSLVRESIYTFFHYNTFRFLKDTVLMDHYNTNSTFIPAFVAGVVAITMSQPF
jgi:predicted thioredoxin/glutaredoxin